MWESELQDSTVGQHTVALCTHSTLQSHSLSQQRITAHAINFPLGNISEQTFSFKQPPCKSLRPQAKMEPDLFFQKWEWLLLYDDAKETDHWPQKVPYEMNVQYMLYNRCPEIWHWQECFIDMLCFPLCLAIYSMGSISGSVCTGWPQRNQASLYQRCDLSGKMRWGCRIDGLSGFD